MERPKWKKTRQYIGRLKKARRNWKKRLTEALFFDSQVLVDFFRVAGSVEEGFREVEAEEEEEEEEEVPCEWEEVEEEGEESVPERRRKKAKTKKANS